MRCAGGHADAWCSPDLNVRARLGRPAGRILVSGPGRSGRAAVLASLLRRTSWTACVRSRPGCTGLLARRRRDRRVDTVADDGPFVDCGSVASYLQANLLAVGAAGGAVVDPTAACGPASVVTRSVVGAGARVEGEVRDTVVWPGAGVAPGEVVERAVRTPARTVLVR
jgi:hypothetical protein